MKIKIFFRSQWGVLALGVTLTVFTISATVFAQAPARTFPRTDEPSASQSGDARLTKTPEEEQIGRAIAARLQSDWMVPSYQVTTVVSNGVVILDG